MITNLKIGNFGRLGNQFFQYAILKSIAIKNRYDIVLPSNENNLFHGQEFLLKRFNLDCKFQPSISIDNILNEDEPNVFYPEFLDAKENTSVQGYFQNLNYFDHIKSILKKEFEPQKNYLNQADEYFNFIKKKYPNKKIASFHIRRGDFFKFRFTDITNGNVGLSLYGSPFWLSKKSIFYKYFQKVIKEIDIENTVFIVFSGGSRNSDKKNLRWLEKCFKGLNFEISKSVDPVLDFTLMLKADINVLSFASSFGWWAAYLNENKQKYAPENYFYGIEGANIDYLFNDEFKLL